VRRVILSAALAVSLVACGSRTDLDLGLVPSDASAPGNGGSPDAPLSSLDGDFAPPDAGRPPRDATSRPPDAGVDAAHKCNDGGLLEVSYLFDDSGILYRLDPPTGKIETLGTVGCADANPWTMTVGRNNAYIVYDDWTIWAVDLATLACSQTLFQPGQLGLEAEFGVAAVESGAGEEIFVYGVPAGGSNPILAVGDTTSFALSLVGEVLPVPDPSSFPTNLTADAKGHVYAYSPDGLLQQIDEGTAAVVSSMNTAFMSQSTWASLTYGTSIFLFADDEVQGLDIATGTPTASYILDVSPIGAGSVLICNGP
jgi:hypothetical protein